MSEKKVRLLFALPGDGGVAGGSLACGWRTLLRCSPVQLDAAIASALKRPRCSFPRRLDTRRLLPSGCGTHLRHLLVLPFSQAKQAVDAAARVAAKAAKGDAAAALEDDSNEETDPTKYFENRVKTITAAKVKSVAGSRPRQALCGVGSSSSVAGTRGAHLCCCRLFNEQLGWPGRALRQNGWKVRLCAVGVERLCLPALPTACASPLPSRRLQARGENPYPHKYYVSIQLPAYVAKYGSLEPGSQVGAALCSLVVLVRLTEAWARR